MYPEIILDNLKQAIKKSGYDCIPAFFFQQTKDESRKSLNYTLFPQDIAYGRNEIMISPDLYLGLNISFGRGKLKSKQPEEKQNLEFKSISLQFYHKDVKICKAEWSNEEYNQDEVHHPQPHWHFEKESHSEDVSENMVGVDFEDFLQKEEPEDSGKFDPNNVGIDVFEERHPAEKDDGYDIARMHFAICSPWYDYNNRNKLIKPNSDILLSWFKSCLESMIHEHKFRYTPH